MSNLDTSQVASPIVQNENYFRKIWRELCIYLENGQFETVPANLIYKHKDFCKFLISQNHGIIDSQIPRSITELEREKYKLQTEEYYQTEQELRSTIYILTTKNSKGNKQLVKSSSQILFVTLNSILKGQSLSDRNENAPKDNKHSKNDAQRKKDTEQLNFLHFVNILRNSIMQKKDDWSISQEYYISEDIFNSFCALFPYYINQLKIYSDNQYIRLWNKISPIDAEIRKIDMQIRQKLKEIVEDRISYIVLPSGKRLQVIY